MRNFLAFLYRLFILAIVAALICPRSFAQQDQIVSGGGYYLTLAQNVAWNQLSQNYIFTPLTPDDGVCLYIQNNNPTSAHSFTLQIKQTGDSSLTKFQGNSAKWTAATVYNTPASVSAGAVVSLFASIQAAARVTVAISGTSSASGSPDTANIFGVQTATGVCGAAGGAIAVQGPTAPGQVPTSNPVYVGGQVIDQANELGPIPLVAQGGISDPGLNLGQHVGTTLAAGAVRMFGQNANEVIATAPYAFNSIANTWDEPAALASPSTAGTTPQGSLFTTDGGVQFQILPTINTSTVQNLTSHSPGMHPGCTFLLTATGVTGTNPTLDVYIQDSNDNSTWNDRIHFQQMTATTNLTQIAAIASGQIAVSVPVTASIAAGTIVGGNLAPFLRAQFVVGGTNPSFPISLTVNCQ